MRNVILSIMFILALSIGCTDETIVQAPEESAAYRVTLAGLPDKIQAPEGVAREIPFSALVTDADGIPASGVKVTLSVAAGPGEATPASSVTDASGRVNAIYALTVPQGQSNAQILAAAGERTASATIRLAGGSRPARINLQADAPKIVVPDRQNAVINMIATVSDAVGANVPAVNLRFRLLAYDEETPVFGSISAPGPTDENGVRKAEFNSGGGFGRLTVQCVIDEGIGYAVDISAEIIVEVAQLESQVRSLTMQASPSFLLVDRDSLARSELRIQALDESRHAVANLRVNLMTNLGGVDASAVTDASGIAGAKFMNNFEEGTATVTASVAGTGVEASTTIDVFFTGETGGGLTLHSDRSFIYADNGLTRASLTVHLTDQDGGFLVGRTINISTTQGSVEREVITDSLGMTRAIFTDIGIPSPPDANGDPTPAVITAEYRPLGLRAETRVTILERNPVTLLYLTASRPGPFEAGSDDSLAIRAVCYLANENPAPEGTVVYFEATRQTFSPPMVPISGRFGGAESYYLFGNRVGVDTVWAYVLEDGVRIYSNMVLIELIAGPPSRVQVTADPRQLNTNDPHGYSTITALVTDTAGNTVRQGTLVMFTTTLGSITPSGITNEAGRAMARLTAGVTAGVATVTASVNTPSGTITGQTTVPFISGMPNSIELTADPPQLDPRGSGGTTTSTLRATLRDLNGNLVIMPTTVVFELINEPPWPQGSRFAGSDWDLGRMDSSVTGNGVATATLEAGERTGGKLIRAYTWRDSLRNDTVSVVSMLLTITSGPPYGLDIDLNTRGQDAGGGAWQVDVSVRVWDVYRNPVRNGIPVVVTVDPEVATISPGATVGGVAVCPMIYNSINTFDQIEITAEVQTADGPISGSRLAQLPFQRGELQLNLDPDNWMFDQDREQATIRCTAVVRDGHGIAINGAPVLFGSIRGRLHWYDPIRRRLVEFYPDPARKLSENGAATVFLIAEVDDIFLDPFTLEVSVQITARVEGYDDVYARPEYVFFTRRAG